MNMGREIERGGTTAAPIFSTVPIKHDDDEKSHDLDVEVKLQNEAHSALRWAPDLAGKRGCGGRS
jgi:hypothetical protein